MKNFIESILHQKVEIKKYTGNQLPLITSGNFRLHELEISGFGCILAEPRENFGLPFLRAQHRQIERITGKRCVLGFERLGAYPRQKMLEAGISFVWVNHQIYMPFLGIALKQNEARDLKECIQISFLTQKMLLMALYENWQDVTVTMAANMLNVSKMSISRCYDEIESLGIPVLKRRGRVRVINSCGNKNEMWNEIKPYMRSPLIKEYVLCENIDCSLPKSGISALCEYSLLNDNSYNTYGILKKQLSEYKIKSLQLVSKGAIPGCVVQELGYVIPYKDGSVIDPLTVFMLMEKGMDDPRIEGELEAMLEEYVW